MAYLPIIGVPEVFKIFKCGRISRFNSARVSEDIIYPVGQSQLNAFDAAELYREGGSESLSLSIRLQAAHHAVIPGIFQSMASPYQ